MLAAFWRLNSGYRPKISIALAVPLVGSLAGSCLACRSDPPENHVKALYDETSGRLSQLTVNAEKDGKPNTFSYMNGSKFVRIEIDNDEDGKIDRWEYYRPDQTIERVGFSRANDGRVDAWAFQGADGLVSRVEVSTKRDGKTDRTEFYEKGTMVRAEQDTDADGRIDKWEKYEGGALVSVSFDTAKAGKPTTTVDYNK